MMIFKTKQPSKDNSKNDEKKRDYMSMCFQDVRDDLIWYDMLSPFCYYSL
jgi:hypothetical protein